MQYAIFLYADAGIDVSPEDPTWQASIPHHMAFNQALQERGLAYNGGALTGAAAATTIRGRLVTDGPFAETKEQLGGYYVVDAPDLDVVLELCDLLWEAEHGAIEVRPLLDVPAPDGAPGTGVAAG